ncbi:MAG: hypothetical protein ACKOCX_13675 [Planctomycetota bacterium]
MLYSRSANIAFAHYPKTAGHSLVAWLRQMFPDVAFVDPPPVYTISHFAVRESLERLGLAMPAAGSARGGWRRRLPRWLGGPAAPSEAGGLRIIGVLREPFEMLVSLYEYWRTYQFHEPPKPELIRAARERPFPEFLAMAVVDQHVRNYRDFFDVGGPAWPATRLLAFESLGPALARACREFGVPPPAEALGHCNTGPRPGRDLGPYHAAAGDLVASVRRHFAWYYDEGVRVMLRG